MDYGLIENSFNHTVCFFTGTPPKKFKYGKPRLGESTSTGKRRQSCKTRQDKARMDPATNWRCHTIAKNVFAAGH